MTKFVLDGTDANSLQSVAYLELKGMQERHYSNIFMFTKMGGYAPTMGIIGTVMGLIMTLANAGMDPNLLIKNIATAFIATLWGVFSANILWLPVGDRLKRCHSEEKNMMEISLEGVLTLPERRDSFDNESKTSRNASAKRTTKQNEFLDSEENPFSESGDKDRYLITYADLITLLLGLFIILYAISNIDSTKYKGFVAAMSSYFGHESVVPRMSDSKIITKPKDKLSEELNKLIIDNNYSNSIHLEETERGITIHILDDILFPPGKAVINESSKLVLKRLIKFLLQFRTI